MVRKEYVVEEVQKMMEKIDHIRNIAIVAHVDHGKCVSGKTRILTTDGAILTAEELFDLASKKGATVKKSEDEVIYDLSKDNISIYSLNKKTGQIEKKHIQYAWKLKGGNMLNVTLRNGLAISTTPEHKYLVFEGMNFAEKKAENLGLGDRIVCARRLSTDTKMNLKKAFLLGLKEKPFYLRLNKRLGKRLREKTSLYSMKEITKLSRTKLSVDGFRMCINGDRYRLSDILRLAALFEMPTTDVYDNTKAIFYREGGKKSHNSKEMLPPENFGDFFYLAGLFLGDGHADKLVVGKEELGEEFVRICDGLGIKPYFRNYEGKTPEIGSGCKALVEILTTLFGYSLKRKSHSIRISDFVFKAPDECVARFIKGYFDCDGTVEESRRAVSVSSASHEMLRGLQLLLLRFGCPSQLSDNTLYVSGLSVEDFAKHIGFKLRGKAERLISLKDRVTGSRIFDAIPLDKQRMTQIRKGISMNQILHHYYQYESGSITPAANIFNGVVGYLEGEGVDVGEIRRFGSDDLTFIEVSSIDKVKEKEVFDFTIPDNHNFIAEGMVIHNTTMTDSLVARAGLMSKDLAGEQLIMDFEEQERKRGITIKSANISLGFNLKGEDYLVNLIDTPGHVDFGGHVTRAMRAVDGIVLVVDAVEGVMPQTETVLRQALKEKAKPALFINKVDRLVTELKLSTEGMQERLKKVINEVNKIIKDYAADEYRDDWLINVEKGNVAFGSALNKWAVSATSMKRFNIGFKEICERSSKGEDDYLVEHSPLDEVILEMVITHLPNPLVAQEYRIPIIWKGDVETEEGKMMRKCDQNGKTIGICFGVTTDEHAGEVAVTRLFSGTVRKGDDLYLASKFKTEKVQQAGVYMGPNRITVDHVSAGNIAAIVGLRDVYIGETISDGPVEPFEEIKHYAEPVVTKSIEAKDAKDLAKLIIALRRIAKEDPTIRVEINQETGEHLISGMGELHLEIIEYKIDKEKKIPIVTSPPIVVYRETISKRAGPVEGKSPNGHNKLRFVVEPLEKGVYDAMVDGKIKDGKPKGKTLVETFVEAGLPREEAKKVLYVYNRNLLVNDTRGIQYLNEVMELLVQGFQEAMAKGPLAKEKVSGVKVRLVDAAFHEDAVHRGPAQMLPTTRRPIYACMLMAGVSLQEPKQNVLIQVPQDFVGDVINLVQGRRGQLLSMDQKGETTTAKVKMAVAEMFGFANAMRSATQGRAIWYQEYAGFEPLPRELLDKVVRKIRERKGEKPEPPKAEDFLD